MTSQLTFRGSFKQIWQNIPVTVEWELETQHLKDDLVLRKIGVELRRIAETMRKAERRELKRRRNLHLQDVALWNLRRLFAKNMIKKCAVCADPIAVKVFPNGEYEGGHFFGVMEFWRGGAHIEAEYWECNVCFSEEKKENPQT